MANTIDIDERIKYAIDEMRRTLTQFEMRTVDELDIMLVGDLYKFHRILKAKMVDLYVEIYKLHCAALDGDKST